MVRPSNRGKRIDRRTVLKAGAIAASGGLVTRTASASRDITIPRNSFETGDSIAVGDGAVTAYVTTNPVTGVTSLGAHVDNAALDALGNEEVTATLSFPTETAAGEAIDLHQFTFLQFDYLPEGHWPEGVYDTPHLDIQCFMLDQQTIEEIAQQPATYAIPKTQMPTDHVRPKVVDTDDSGSSDAPIVEAGRGEPIADPGSSEHHDGGKFTHTHIYGAYDPDGDGVGRLTLFEPMVTVDFADRLDTMVDVELKTPAAYATADEYPTSYVLQPESDGGLYVSLTDFESFPGPN